MGIVNTLEWALLKPSDSSCYTRLIASLLYYKYHRSYLALEPFQILLYSLRIFRLGAPRR